MPKAPASQFYWGDWLNDVELQSACSASRGIWANALGRMWYSKTRGELTATPEKYIQILNCTPQEFSTFLDEAETLLFCYVSRNGNGTVTLRNRRMYREEKERENARLRQERFRGKRKSNGAKNGKVTVPSSSSSSKKKIYKRKVLLPKDYKLRSDHIEYAKSKGITEGFEDIFEEFCIHHTKMGSKFIDWYAAWQTWIRKRIEFGHEKKEMIPQENRYDTGAVQEARKELKKISPEQYEKNREFIGQLAKGVGKRV